MANILDDVGTHQDYEKTLMYGRYSELQQFAREFAASHSTSRRKQPPGIEEAKRRKSRAWRAMTWVSENVLPYVLDWLFILILGILMAILSFIIDYIIERIGKAHSILSFQLIDVVIGQFIFWVLYPLVFILLSVSFVQVMSIHAIGSGIPEMKTVLRGIQLTDYLSFRTFLSKSVALVAAFGSSLPIGKEGPFVHLSSIIALQMSKLITNVNRVYANEAHNNELLAAACAIGVSCNFAAPIGGVLFSIEVTSTYFAVRNYWRGFFGAVCGAFLFRLAAVWFKNENTITSLFTTSFRPDYPFDLQELIAFAFIGVVAGFTGAFFVWYHRNYVLVRRKFRRYTRILERHIFIMPVVVTVIFATLTFQPGLGQFMAGELTQHQAIEQLFSNRTWSTLPSRDEIDELPVDSEDYQILKQWGLPNIWVSLILFMVVRFIFTAIAVSLPIPSGIFFPVFVIGAAFGRLIGEAMAVWFGTIGGYAISPGGYAVVGAAAMAGAVTHTISTSVIVFELTGQITHILPVMIAVLIANSIASLLQPSVYDSIILLKGLSFLPDLKHSKVYNLMATDIMRSDVVFLSYGSTYKDLKLLLHSTLHASYPLVDAPESRILIGSVSRRTLTAMLDEHLSGVYEHAQQIRGYKTDSEPEQATLAPPTKPPPQRSTPSPSGGGGFGQSIQRRISSVPHSLAKMFGQQDETDSGDVTSMGSGLSEDALEQLRDDLLSQPIDFKKTHIDPAPFQLVERTSLYKIHSLFSILALSHAYVTSIGRLVGVVTLSDLTDAIRGRPKQSQPRDPTTVEMIPPVSDTEAETETETEAEPDTIAKV